ncbi:MAG: YcxB family protein [Oscillospiraceae bacterium]|nr:YcxB family protein [Oscillospiraceae bacterium]
MSVKIETVYTEDSLLNFAKFSVLGLNKRTRIKDKQSFYLLIWAISASVLAGLAAMSIRSYQFLILPVFVDSGVLSLVLAVFLFAPKIITKNSKHLVGAVNSFVFSDNEITIFSSLPLVSGQSVYNIDCIESICETEHAFYLYVPKNQAYIINKQDISSEEFSNLYEYIRLHIPQEKYRAVPSIEKLPVVSIVILCCLIFLLFGIYVFHMFL